MDAANFLKKSGLSQVILSQVSFYNCSYIFFILNKKSTEKMKCKIL